MTTENRQTSGSWSESVSTPNGFDWMTPGLWDLECEVAPTERILRDLAACETCLREVSDPGNRRHRYPFTSCPECGPRHSILRRMPFIRANTTMSGFTMCEACATEYEDPNDRRYGHESNCCAWCGPALGAVSPAGEGLGTTDPVTLAARALRAQLTLALKGDGDFHLVCDATSATAVTRMRNRAGMRDSSLTVMVRDLEEARRIASLTEKEISLLTSVERPVVLVSIRTDSPLAGEVAAGNQLAGLLLPYTPLHHLLLSETGRPLVFAPADVQDSTLLSRNSAAVSVLRNVADIIVLHDRPIAARDDDSVARVVDDRIAIEHRSRGIAPFPVALRWTFATPLVGMGAGPATTVCFASGDSAGLEPFHPGDESSETAIDRALQRAHDLFGIEPKVIAVDANERHHFEAPDERQKIEIVSVHHHHAHYASCMAENGLTGKVIAVVYDGGAPGICDLQWGGEILVGDLERFERVSTLRPIALPGAKAVRRHAWTAALSLLDDVFDGQPPLHALAVFRNLPRRSIDVVRRVRSRSACLTSGAQVYLDALGSIILNRPETSLDGTLSRELDLLADPSCEGRYPVVIRDGTRPWEIDVRMLVRQATLDFIEGIPPATIAARVRNTVVEFTAEVLLAYGGGQRDLPVVLSGDLFERTRLAGPIRERLGDGARVFTHALVPAGDQGIGLGQALIADARSKKELRVDEVAAGAGTIG